MKQDTAKWTGDDRPGPASGPASVDKMDSQAEMRLVSDRADTGQGASQSPPDRVTQRAMDCGLVSKDEIVSIFEDVSENEQLSWRHVALRLPEVAEALRQLAADTYGFRKILVCEVGTLVYNNLLTRIISPLHWQRIFDEKVVPVLEYGKSPEKQDRLILGAADPSSRAVRDLVHELPLTPVDLVYVPSKMISDLQELLISNLNAIRMAVLTDHRMVIREFIDSDDGLVPNEIIRRAA